MSVLGFVVSFEAKAGQENEVEQFLVDAKAMVDAEPGTRTWHAFRSGPTTFGIFDTFDDEEARETHLNGEVRKAIEARGDELFAVPPTITPVDVVAHKLPV